ncbi:MAG: DUF1587 domain-containing protein, partial [Pirellula sp.]
MSRPYFFATAWIASFLALSASIDRLEAADTREEELHKSFPASVQSIVQKHCSKCHNEQLSEAEVDLTQWSNWEHVKKQTRTIQRVLEQFQTQQMPPPEEPQPSVEDRQRVIQWLEAWLTLQAERYAGDPGPVILRRLNNSEYTNTIRDLTNLREIQPAKEFPADSAAGEGFSNTGAALVMSPSLVRKYLDAAKSVAEHVVLLPDGITFADNPSRSDMTNLKLDEIRRFYAPFSDQSGGAQVNLQGIVFETNQGGRLPIEKYLIATLKAREALKVSNQDVSKTLESMADSDRLSVKYLKTLWQQLHDASAKGLLATIQKRWQETSLEKPEPLVAEVLSWQKALWKFSSVGHIGKRDGPKSWQEPVNPIRTEQELRISIPKDLPVQGNGSNDVVYYLQVSDAGDGSQDDAVVIANPRLVAPGRPDLSLRGLDSFVQTLSTQQELWAKQTETALMALDGWLEDPQGRSLEELASESRVPVELMKAWARTLGLSDVATPAANSNADRRRLTSKSENMSGYAFIAGWVAEDALSIVANSSDQHVRIPGNMPPKSIAVHPSPSRSIATAWKAPAAMKVDCQANVRHAHTECGNGIAWRLELRRGSLNQVLASGFSAGAKDVPVGPYKSLRVRANDEIVLVIEPRDSNHSCDLTTIDLTITAPQTPNAPGETWSLSQDLHPNILAGNPHADSQGRPGIWEFFTEPALGNKASNQSGLIPPESLLAKWFNEPDVAARKAIISELHKLIIDPKSSSLESPDGLLVRRLLSASGPFFLAAMESNALTTSDVSQRTQQPSSTLRYGWKTEMFGAELGGSKLAENEALIQAPGVIEIRLPASIAAGAELVAKASL